MAAGLSAGLTLAGGPAFSSPSSAPPVAATANPSPAKPKLMLMTGLPIVWGEAGPFDPSSRPALSYRALQDEFEVELIDTFGEDAPTDRLLLLAQPQRLAPGELAAVDGWVRRGGHALIFADPMLVWPSGLPIGDIRRPPPIHLLEPLLMHWGLKLEAPDAAERQEAKLSGLRFVTEAAGRFASAARGCRVGPEWLARCRIGRGQAIVVADADLFRDDLWIPEGHRKADNPMLVANWLDLLAGVERERHLPAAGSGVPLAWLAAAAAALLAVGIGLKRRRRRG